MSREGMGNRLKRLRKERGLSLRDVRDVTRISIAHLSGLERESKGAGIDVLIKLARFYGVSLDFIVDADWAQNAELLCIGGGDSTVLSLYRTLNNERLPNRDLLRQTVVGVLMLAYEHNTWVAEKEAMT